MLLIAVSRVPTASGPAPRPTDQVRLWEKELGRGGGGPEKAGEFSRAGNDGQVVRLAAGAHSLVDAVQSLLGVVADRQDVVGLSELAVGQRGAEPGVAAVVPGGLDQQPAGEHRAGLRDRCLARGLPGLRQRRGQPQPR